MRASLLPNGHLVVTGKTSRQSLSQGPVLGRHGNKQSGAQEMGERSQREAGRCMIISDPVTCSSHDTQPCGHPMCFTDQRTHSLLRSSVPLTQTGSTSPHTHTHTHTHRLTHSPPPHTQPHTTSHTFPHSSHTPHSPSLTHTYSSHTLIHHLHTPHTLHKHIHSSHPHTPSHIHTLTHTHSSCPHTHTPSTHSSPAHIHTHNHRAYRSEDTGCMGTQRQCSHTRHVEHVGTAKSPS